MSREQALELAERMVSFSRGVFDLGLIGAPTPVDQRWLLAGLRERLGAGTALLEVAADTLGQDPLAELRRLPAADVLAVFGLHADHLALFKALNIQRDQLVAARPIPWLLLGHPAGIRSLAERAPDFVDFASFRELVDAPEGPPPSASTLEIRAAPELFGDPLLDRMWLAGEWDGLVQRLHHAVVARPDEPKAKMQLASLLLRRGEVEEARRHLQAAGDAWERLGDVHSRALTMGQIADILQARGQLDEALRIRKEEELPVYERLGDVRSRAVTMGMIADILQARGQLDDALRIRKEEELPVYERLGDVRSRAVTMGKIADILEDRGQLDEALRIRKEEELPVYTRLGDVRSRAVTMGQIADILQARGQLDEALRIRKRRELPVYERLGDVRSRAVTMGKIADILQARGQLDDALRIRAKRNNSPSTSASATFASGRSPWGR
jgi:tetratricopeptide (TPR) repeat protein